jgi:hypothetical protein
MKTKCLVSCVLGIVISATAALANQAWVTDLDTGRAILLEAQNGKTLVTDWESGETLVVEGTWAAQMTDESYTDMMRRKRDVAAQRRASWMRWNTINRKAVIGSGNYSVSGGDGGWDSPSYAAGAGTLRVNISGTCSRPSGDYVNVTVWRSISFWLDSSYGTKAYFVDSNGETATKNWSLDVSGNYYLEFDKTYNSYWAYGSYSLSQ